MLAVLVVLVSCCLPLVVYINAVKSLLLSNDYGPYKSSQSVSLKYKELYILVLLVLLLVMFCFSVINVYYLHINHLYAIFLGNFILFIMFVFLLNLILLLRY